MREHSFEIFGLETLLYEIIQSVLIQEVQVMKGSLTLFMSISQCWERSVRMWKPFEYTFLRGVCFITLHTWGGGYIRFLYMRTFCCKANRTTDVIFVVIVLHMHIKMLKVLK